MRRHLLLAASLILTPSAGFAAQPAAPMPDRAACLTLEARITGQVQDMGVAFTRRLGDLTYPVSLRTAMPPKPPPEVTMESLYRDIQAVRAAPGRRIQRLQAQVKAGLAAMSKAGCPAYALPTDPETYWSPATVCDTARSYDSLDADAARRGEAIEPRPPEYVTASACDRTTWEASPPMRPPGEYVDLPLINGPPNPGPVAPGG